MQRPLSSIAILALLVAACSTPVSATPDLTTSAPTTANPATPSISPLPTAASRSASPTPSASQETTAVGDGIDLFIEDPKLRLTLPEAWHQMSMAEIVAEVDSLDARGVSAGEIANLRTMIDDHVIRAAALGWTPRGVSIGIVLYVVEDLATLDQGVEWVSDEVAGANVVSIDREHVELSIDAEVVRLHQLSDVAPEHEETGIPSQSISYVIRLASGQTVIVNSTSVQDDKTFVPMMERMIATLTVG